jgi:Fe2+ transport system protein FeoA
MRLSDLRIGTLAVLDHFPVSPLHRKMLSMGMLPGQQISVVRKVPLRGSLYVKVNDRLIALRFREAQNIMVHL